MIIKQLNICDNLHKIGFKNLQNCQFAELSISYLLQENKMIIMDYSYGKLLCVQKKFLKAIVRDSNKLFVIIINSSVNSICDTFLKMFRYQNIEKISCDI